MTIIESLYGRYVIFKISNRSTIPFWTRLRAVCRITDTRVEELIDKYTDLYTELKYYHYTDIFGGCWRD